MGYRETEIRNLIDLSLKGLEKMQRSDNLFCYKTVDDGNQILTKGKSVRYTLICLIGMAKAIRCGYELPFKPSDIWPALIANLNSQTLTTGDYGLYLWANELYNFGYTDRILSILGQKLLSDKIVNHLTGMERGWIVYGLCLAAEKGYQDAYNELGKILSFIIHKTVAPSGLFFHTGSKNFRSKFPCFATQIYCIHALIKASKTMNNKTYLRLAMNAADVLCQHQLSDGGWAWIMNTDNGSVAEPYEIYSVHQDAMAPMALIPLYEETGNIAYLKKVLSGLIWIFGRNELSSNMINETGNIIFRSIRRKPVFSRLALYTNVLGNKLFNFSPFGRKAFVELNRTCRPYHLGWILEAWCGREALLEGKLPHIFFTSSVFDGD